MEKNTVDLLYKELSYEIQGIAFEVRKNFGPGHKEVIYQKAFEEELKSRNISYEKEKAIKIFSPKTGNFIGLYRPDFLVDRKIIVELKSQAFLPQMEQTKINDDLRNSQYELGYLINFGSKNLYIKRTIFTNDKKPVLKFLASISLALVLFSGLWTTVKAAGFEFFSEQPAYLNQPTKVDVVLKGFTEPINTLSGKLIYNQNEIELKDVAENGSIVSLWLKNPSDALKENAGEVSFTGFVPGGSLQGKVFSLSFVPKTATSTLQIVDSKVFLNDGQGTALALNNIKMDIISLFSTSSDPNINPAAQENSDNTPPEAFNVQIAQSDKIFNNLWFIVFNTQDQVSGIDHYEVAEINEPSLNIAADKWQKTQSPYVLKDQTRHSYVYVKAVDKAGNSTIARLEPIKQDFEKSRIFGIILSVIFLICALVWLVFRRLKPKNL